MDDLDPVVDLLRDLLTIHTDHPRELAQQLVGALVQTPSMAYRLAIAHAEWRAANP